MNKTVPAVPQKSSITGSFLYDFTTALPDPANVKDVKTNRYIFGNAPMHELYGHKNIENMTVHELTDQLQTPWSKTHADNITVLDEQIKLHKKVIREHNYAQLTAQGFIRISETVKIPLFDHQQQLAAIFTINYDLTQNFDWLHLFSLYKQFYPAMPDAIDYFLKHLRIHHYFSSPLTETELFVLMMLKKRYSRKYAARKLVLTASAVTTHIEHIRQKLQGRNLQQLLESLRYEQAQFN